MYVLDSLDFLVFYGDFYYIVFINVDDQVMFVNMNENIPDIIIEDNLFHTYVDNKVSYDSYFYVSFVILVFIVDIRFQNTVYIIYKVVNSMGFVDDNLQV